MQQQYLINTIASLQTNYNYNVEIEKQSNSIPSSLFVASCPPFSKPLLNPQTQLGQACATWSKCPTGFTCYSNFPDGRNAHCCTTVPLDNQIVFRANTDAASTQQQIPQYAPEIELVTKENKTENFEQITTTAESIKLETMIKCPKGTVNIDGTQCKRSKIILI